MDRPPTSNRRLMRAIAALAARSRPLAAFTSPGSITEKPNLSRPPEDRAKIAPALSCSDGEWLCGSPPSASSPRWPLPRAALADSNGLGRLHRQRSRCRHRRLQQDHRPRRGVQEQYRACLLRSRPCPPEQGRAPRRHRRLQPVAQAQSQRPGRLSRPRLLLLPDPGIRPRHRRLQSDHQAQA